MGAGRRGWGMKGEGRFNETRPVKNEFPQAMNSRSNDFLSVTLQKRLVKKV
jgi:hypothetical protein